MPSPTRVALRADPSRFAITELAQAFDVAPRAVRPDPARAPLRLLAAPRRG